MKKNAETIIIALITVLVYVIGMYISAKIQSESIDDDMSFATLFLTISFGIYVVFGFVVVWIKDVIDGKRLRKANKVED